MRREDPQRFGLHGCVSSLNRFVVFHLCYRQSPSAVFFVSYISAASFVFTTGAVVVFIFCDHVCFVHF